MAKQVKYLKQVVSHLEGKYGPEKAEAIMTRALARYADLLEENSDEPTECHMHTRERIYPSISVFDALIAEGVEREEAENFVVEYYKWRSEGMADKIKALLRVPGLYKIIPKFFFNMTKKSFGPKAGFRSENEYLGNGEMRFDMVVCPYHQKCTHYGCPEIVHGFCDADDICYGNMHPKIVWGRTRTIGYGYDVCDFNVRIEEPN